MKHSLTILTAALAITGTLAAAPLKPDQIPAAAKWFLHIDFDGLRETATGKDLFAQVEEQHGRQFRAIKRMFSLNPLTDLAGVTLMGPGGKDMAVALIDGRFDRAHIEDIIGAADDYDTHRHGDFTVHEWTDDKKGKPQFGAFVSDNLIAFSEQEGLLHDALDVLGGKKDSLPADPYCKKNGAFAAGWARLADIEVDDEESQLLRKAEELRMIVALLPSKPDRPPQVAKADPPPATVEQAEPSLTERNPLRGEALAIRNDASRAGRFLLRALPSLAER